MKVTVIVERTSEGWFSCYMEDKLPGFGLTGHGYTAERAKADLMVAFEEIKEMLKEEGKEVPDLEMEFRYDLQSFFDFFSVLNATRLAEKAGINASLLRQYRSGAAKASQKQYSKLEKAVHEIGKELIVAKF
jgi:predicted RNase H-like HicB family nuclease